MEGYLSDEEQVQRLKDWWKKYGTAVLLALVVFLAANVGWRFWNKYKTGKSQQASMVYEEMFNANMMHKVDSFKLLAQHIIKDYGSTPYASMASLLLARQNVSANNLPAAENNLNWVIKNSSGSSLRQIARIRKARVLLALNQPREAMQVLNKIDDVAFDAMTFEVKGDINLAMHKKDAALVSYQQAVKAAGDQASPALKMKLDMLK